MIKNVFLKNWAQSSEFPFYINKCIVTDDFVIHKHDFTELAIIISGTATHIIDNQEFKLEAGDVYLMNKYVTHGFKAANNLVLCNIMFNDEDLLKYNDDLKTLPGFQAFFILEPFYRREHEFKSRLRLTHPALKTLMSIVDSILHEYNTKGDGYISLIKSYFISLVVYLCRNYVNYSIKPEVEKLIRIGKAVAYIEKFYLEKINNSKVAILANISLRHFIRIFKEVYGTTPMDYIIRLRLEYSISLLSIENQTLTDIAFSSGFSDSNYYSRMFKKRYGITPGQFRMQFLNK